MKRDHTCKLRSLTASKHDDCIVGLIPETLRAIEGTPRGVFRTAVIFYIPHPPPPPPLPFPTPFAACSLSGVKPPELPLGGMVPMAPMPPLMSSVSFPTFGAASTPRTPAALVEQLQADVCWGWG